MNGLYNSNRTLTEEREQPVGGQNHQPCGSYLLESTHLSRSLSLSRSELELANVSLEDALLLEIEHQKPGSLLLANMIEHLTQGKCHLADTLNWTRNLKAKMERLSYQDLPEINTIDLETIGKQLVHHQAVDGQAWDEMAQMMRDGSFYANVAYFESEITQLQTLTVQLLDAVSSLSGCTSVRDQVEENGSNNIKLQFARLYHSWHAFQARFLASSLISTSIWYAHIEAGNIGNISKSVPIVAAT